MKKVLKIENLDCANCAAKLERRISKIDGVIKANVNFIGERLTLEADDERFDAVLQETIRLAKIVEPDCKITLR